MGSLIGSVLTFDTELSDKFNSLLIDSVALVSSEVKSPDKFIILSSGNFKNPSVSKRLGQVSSDIFILLYFYYYILKKVLYINFF